VSHLGLGAGDWVALVGRRAVICPQALGNTFLRGRLAEALLAPGLINGDRG
jgi:hypothetical protein